MKQKFTKWYVKRGYQFEYDFMDPLMCTSKPIWTCPLWVRPFLIFFSPSVYCQESMGKLMIGWFEKGLEAGLKEKKRIKNMFDIFEDAGKEK